MPRHLISDAHEWINEIPTVPIYSGVSAGRCYAAVRKDQSVDPLCGTC